MPKLLGKKETVVLETRVVNGSGGGPDKTILQSPRYLASAGYRTLCAYLHPPQDPGFEKLQSKARVWQAPLLSIHDRGPWDWKVVADLLSLCRRERVALWHGHDYKSNALGLLLRRFRPMRLVTTVHGWVHHTARTPFYYWIDRWCLPHYEMVICVSEDLRQQCLACGVSQERCVLVENAVDTVDYGRRVEAAEAKARLGIPSHRLVIGAVGRLSPEKGFDLLIRAAHRLLLKGFDLELLIAGEGAERAPLEKLIENLKVASRIRLLGYRPDTRDIYQAMDLFVLSSFREGLPNVLLEAMATQVPVVATRIGGVPSLISHGENGLVVEPGDEEGLAKAIETALVDRPLRTRLGQAGRATVESQYSFQTRMQKIREIYDRLLSRSPLEFKP